MPKKCSVKSWNKPAKQAAHMNVGLCGSRRAPMIGFDLIARAGNTFAHGHLDIESAEEFVAAAVRAIAQGRQVMADEAKARRQTTLESDAEVKTNLNG